MSPVEVSGGAQNERRSETNLRTLTGDLTARPPKTDPKTWSREYLVKWLKIYRQQVDEQAVYLDAAMKYITKLEEASLAADEGEA